MKIKGTALLARKAIIERSFGAKAWTSLLDDMRPGCPSLETPLTASSLFPVPEFLRIHDEIVRRFYEGNDAIYWTLGEQSAEWALTEGPYKSFMTRKDLESFVQSFPNLWVAYFHETESTCEATLVGDRVTLDARNLPVWHPYFEYLVTGYMKRGLELLGVHASVHRLEGGPRAGNHFRYEFRLTR